MIEIYKYKNHLNNMGINYLLNVGLDGLGRIPMESIKILNSIVERYNEVK